MKKYFIPLICSFLSILFLQNVSLSQTNESLPTTNGIVYAVAVSGNTIYIGGSFSSVGGTARNSIAAIDATTKTVTSWNPNVSGGGASVYTIAISGTDIYVGGFFTTIGGQARNNIAKLNNTTGNADATWDPNANSTVNTIAIGGTAVYAGGNFTTIGGAGRNYIAALSSTSTGAVTSWNPNANAAVRTLVYYLGAIFVGGDFTTIATGNRNYLAMVAEGGSLQPFNPSPNAKVYSIAVTDNNVIYIGGLFSTVDSAIVNHVPRSGLAAVNGSGDLLPWNPSHQGSTTEIYAIAFSGSIVYVGGKFTRFVSTTRNNIAAVNTSGTVTSWDPNVGVAGGVGDGVHSIALDFTNGRVYAGGLFNSVLGVSCSDFVGLTNTADAALPVELTSFKATTSLANVYLNWSTATEVNNYGFEIQRQKTEIRNQKSEWENIGFVQGSGNSNSPKEYSFTDTPTGGQQFQYRLKQIDFDGKFEYSETIEAKLETPANFALLQNFPNPFNPSTIIRFELPKESNVTLKVFNILGEEVATLVNKVMTPGRQEVTFDGSKLASGMYIYRIQAGNFVEVKKLLLLK